MKPSLVCIFAGLLTGFAVSAPAAEATGLRYGLYIHYGMDTFRVAGEKGQLPVERFAPGNVDVTAWARAAKGAGMTFAVLTAKHESGFCLWESKGYSYDITHSPFKGDLIADFIAACNAEGIVPGVHYSIPDAHNEGAIRSKGAVPPPYFAIIKQHLTELYTKYPGLRVLLIDCAQRLSPSQFDELTQIVQHLNSQCVVWPTSVDLHGPYHQSATVNKGWMWSAASPLNPAPRLFNTYQQCQSAGKAFLLNVGPMPAGNIPDNQLAVLNELKDLIAHPPAPSPAAGASGGKPPAAERLKQVKQLYDQGLIGKEDYDKKVKEIVDSL
jgi:alpha-L-fucosidase